MGCPWRLCPSVGNQIGQELLTICLPYQHCSHCRIQENNKYEKYRPMGQVSSTLIQQNRIDVNWTLHSRTKQAINILRDPNGRLAEERIIHLSGDLGQQLQTYNYRRTQNLGIVKVYAVLLLTPKYSCGCGNGPTLKVISEYLPHRLYSLAPLTQHEAMYVLTEALRIFRQIYIRHGPIHIDEDLFGFTPEGKVRIWCNPNFAVNTPARKIESSSEDNRSEAYMVEKVIDVVQENTINRRLPNHFNKIFNALPYLDFNMAQKAMAEYSRNHSSDVSVDHVDVQHISPTGERYSIERAPDVVVTETKTEVFKYPLPPVIETVTVHEALGESQVVPLARAEERVMRVSFADVPVTTSFTNNMRSQLGGVLAASTNSLQLKKPPIGIGQQYSPNVPLSFGMQRSSQTNYLM